MSEINGKLPLHLQKKEEELNTALSHLKEAYGLAIKAEEQLRDTLVRAKKMLDENNY